jgi:uncharacterized repeat protein (TIGR01451 family)
MKLFKHFSKRTMVFVAGALVAVAALITIPAISKAGFGPDRPTKAYSDGVAGFDYVTFNSFTGVPNIGDERKFFNGKYADTGSVYSDPMPQVKNGDELTLQVYVHNGADASLNDKPGNPGIAKNTKVRVALPTAVANAQQATAYISADNAQPQTVYDTLDFGAANGGMFQLEYVPGSAQVKGNYINAPLSDTVVTTGAAIGTDALNGQMKGCFKEMVYVTLKVKVKMPQYTLKKEVRMNGETSKDWVKAKDVKVGDETQWRLTFENKGTTALNAVNIVDQVPAGLTVVPSSVKLINGNYPSPGFTFPASAIQDNGRTVNVNIGNYNPGIIGYVIFNTKVEKPGSDVCSAKTLVNKAFATPQGFGAIWDTATVTVPGNECKPTVTPKYACDLLTVTKGENRTVKASVAYTATNGATLKTVTYNWGDGSTPLTTDKTNASYQYKADGTFAITATLTFRVNNADVTGVTSAACAQTVSFTTPTTPPVTPPVAPAEVLPSTGAGSLVGTFAAVVVVSALGYRMFLSRKFAR